MNTDRLIQTFVADHDHVALACRYVIGNGVAGRTSHGCGDSARRVRPNFMLAIDSMFFDTTLCSYS
jgi:hypothetical protein